MHLITTTVLARHNLSIQAESLDDIGGFCASDCAGILLNFFEVCDGVGDLDTSEQQEQLEECKQ